MLALAGVPDSDLLFVGGGANQDQDGSLGGIARVRLASSGVTIDAVDPIASGLVNAAVRALAYCPASGSDAAVADVLLAAMGTASFASSSAGGVIRITDATGSAPSATLVMDIPTTMPVNDLRAHCASGTVYVGAGSNSGGPSGTLYRSTNGGASFAPVPISAPGLPPSLNVQVVAIDPDDSRHVLVAGHSEGWIVETTDGGASWSLVNGPTVPGGRNFLSEGVGDLEIPPLASPLVSRSTAAAPAGLLVSTGGGLYTGAASSGGGGSDCSADAECNDGDPCTDDACNGTCQAVQQTGLVGARCEAGQLDTSLCSDGSIDRKLARALAKGSAKTRTLLDKAAAAAKPTKAAKLRARAGKVLAGLAKKIQKNRSVSQACATALLAQIEAIRGLL